MKLLVLFLFGIISSVYSQCPAQGGAAPSAQSLVFCVEYAASSCCTPLMEQQVIGSMLRLNGIYGNTSCYTNARNLACAMACAPTQGQIINIQLGSITTITGEVSPTFASGWYTTCAPACIVPVTNLTVAEVTQGNLTTFLYLFSTDAIPGYVPSQTQPRTIYNITGGASFNATVNTGFNQFLPCPKIIPTGVTGVSSTTAASGTGTKSSVSNVVPSFLVAFIAFCALRVLTDDSK